MLLDYLKMMQNSHKIVVASENLLMLNKTSEDTKVNM